jgi:hypothetical protein
MVVLPPVNDTHAHLLIGGGGSHQEEDEDEPAPPPSPRNTLVQVGFDPVTHRSLTQRKKNHGHPKDEIDSEEMLLGVPITGVVGDSLQHVAHWLKATTSHHHNDRQHHRRRGLGLGELAGLVPWPTVDPVTVDGDTATDHIVDNGNKKEDEEKKEKSVDAETNVATTATVEAEVVDEIRRSDGEGNQQTAHTGEGEGGGGGRGLSTAPAQFRQGLSGLL